ncbi:MAG TPA: MFS transporter [Actinomycetota bacterium]|nr:MFS transporter [Actinomycetota bacterium]
MRRPPAFPTLLAANAVSLLGNVMATIAIPWFVLETTGSAARTGVAAFAAALPMAIGAFAGGPVTDRVGAARASVVADVASGASIAAIPLLHAAGALEFWMLLALAFLGGLFDAPAAAARQALVPELAAARAVSLERANSLYMGTEHVAYVAGAPLAGVLIAVLGAPNVLWLDAASFALSATAVAWAVPAGRARPRRDTTYRDDVREGLRFVRRDDVLTTFLVVPTLGNLLYSPFTPVVLPVYAHRVFDDPAAAGVMIAAYGIGGIAGAALHAGASARWERIASYRVAWVLDTLLLGALLFVPPLPVAVALLFLVGVGVGFIGPIEQTVRQERTPPELRGRVFSTVMAAQLVAAPLGIVVAGALLDVLGLAGTIAAITVANVALTGVVLVSPAVARARSTRAVHARADSLAARDDGDAT